MLTTGVVRSGLASVTHDETRVKLSCFQVSVRLGSCLPVVCYSRQIIDVIRPLPLFLCGVRCSLHGAFVYKARGFVI